MLEGPRREDSMRRMENRWTGVEDRLNAFDQNRDDELVALAYRLDEIKAQINSLDRGTGIEVLESKLVAVAQAIEMLGRQIQPDERRLAPQFADLGKRLDEISRAIAAGSGNVAGTDGSFVGRLENRLGDLSRQIDTLSNPADSGLGARIEALAARVEDLAGEKGAARLEERLDQLSAVLEHNRQGAEPDLTDRLADISRKIEALSGDSVTDALAERSTISPAYRWLARNVEPSRTRRFDRLEDRWQVSPSAWRRRMPRRSTTGRRCAISKLRSETLSTLISQSHGETAGRAGGIRKPHEHAGRLISPPATKYIIEAAPAGCGSRDGGNIPGTPHRRWRRVPTWRRSRRSPRICVHWRNFSRSSGTDARTFEALHETLVHIAEKLERLEEREPPASHVPMPKAAPSKPRAL